MCQDIGDVSGVLAGASSSGGACGGVVVGDVPGSRLRPRVLGEDLAVGVGDGDPVGVPGDQGLLARSGSGDEVGWSEWFFSDSGDPVFWWRDRMGLCRE